MDAAPTEEPAAAPEPQEQSMNEPPAGDEPMLAEQDAAAYVPISSEPVPLGNGSLEQHPAANGSEAAEAVAYSHEPAADQDPTAAAAVAGDEATQAGPSHGDQQPDAEAAAVAAGEGAGGEEEEPRKRRHKWGPPAGGEFAAEGEGGDGPKKKKRKSRWETSDELVVVPAKGSGAIIIPGQIPREVTICGGIKVIINMGGGGGAKYSDPKLQRLHDQLDNYTNKLSAGDYDIPPEHERSPSPEPVYDANGIRLNTREIRYREKMLDRKNRCIEDIIKMDPEYKPPADYRPRKFSRKIYIPVNEYPGYNFIGLIIGPRGNTQKRMQRETNCKIAIRGKGSVKDGVSKDPKYDYGEDEELHVLITGESQEDVDRASAMVEKLCTPSDDEHNEHKQLQLRELALLNGTLKDSDACYMCGQSGHSPEACPNKALDLYKLPENMLSKVQDQYARDVARVHGEPVQRLDDEYRSFLAELGGAPPPEMMGLDASGRPHREQLGDDCKLYVGNLPQVYDKDILRQMFSHLGNVIHSAVITDQNTGLSRGFGFVHFPDAASAKAACDAMNGRMIDGRTLTVRVRSERREAGGGGGGGGGGAPPPRPTPGEVDESKLYVAGLTSHVTEAELRTLFAPYGPIADVRVIMDRETQQCKGYAFVGFTSKDMAAAAMTGMNGYKHDGKNLVVKIAGTKGQGGGGSHMGAVRGPGVVGYPPPGVPGGAVPPPYPPPGAPLPYGAPQHYGVPPPAPPPGAYPPPYGAPPPGMPPQYGGPPQPPYGAPPQGYHHMAPPAYGQPPPYPGAPPAYSGYPPSYPPPAAPPAAPYPGQHGAPPPGYGYDPAAYGGPPPLPPGAPPLPTEAPPLPPGPPEAEYERFMQDLQRMH